MQTKAMNMQAEHADTASSEAVIFRLGKLGSQAFWDQLVFPGTRLHKRLFHVVVFSLSSVVAAFRFKRDSYVTHLTPMNTRKLEEMRPQMCSRTLLIRDSPVAYSMPTS